MDTPAGEPGAKGRNVLAKRRPLSYRAERALKDLHVRIFPAASLAICLGFLAHAAEAQEAPFYAGKTLSLYAGMPVGGGVDDEMRVVARHLGQFIPGKPSVIARNMP